MDFSSIERALSSLLRRQPPLPNSVLEVVTTCLLSNLPTAETTTSYYHPPHDNDNDDDNDYKNCSYYENPQYTMGIIQLLFLGTTTKEENVSVDDDDDGDKDYEASSSSSSPRWEPLAVGLRLVVDYLEKNTTSLPSFSSSSSSSNQIMKRTKENNSTSPKNDDDDDVRHEDNYYEEELDDDDDDDEGTGLGTGGGGVYAEGPRIPKIRNDGSNHDVVPSPPPPPPPSSSSAAASTTTPSLSLPKSSTAPIFELLQILPPLLQTHVEHSEPRVRSLVAQTVGAYARYATTLLNSSSSLSSSSSSSSSSTHRPQHHIMDGGSTTNEEIKDEEEWVRFQQVLQKVQEGRRDIHFAILCSFQAHLEMNRSSSSNETPHSKQSKASDGALDDTTGWRALETNLHGLASYIDGCVGSSSTTNRCSRVLDNSKEDGHNDDDDSGSSGCYIAEEFSLFQQNTGDNNLRDPEKRMEEGTKTISWFLLGLQHCCVVHVNRHVRAAAAAVLGVIVKSCMRSRNIAWQRALLVDPTSPLRMVIKESLRATLADNWSQVRMAGSVLCRRLVNALVKIYARHQKKKKEQFDNEEEKEEKYYDDDDDVEELTVFELALGDLVPILLPRMCLNRFYLAQGVKLYSQETWKLVFGKTVVAHPGSGSGGEKEGGGLGAVARNSASVCQYYSKMCDADNHAVREAACQGVAELAQKMGKHPLYAEYLAPHVTMLLQALLMCFHDESWPVRDEACLACGTFCIAYADECLPELPTIFERWTEQLTDQIWSVREDAAVALGDAITAYGPDMFEKVLAIIRKSIPAAKDQPSMSREEFKKLQNDVAAHTGTQLYSCGSLAPKLRKGGAGRIGCMTCFIDRPRSPWEATDGCIYLLRELCVRFANGDSTERSDVVMNDNILLPLMTELADVCRLSHYAQSDDLRTTLWKQLPPIAEAIGKRRFKGLYLDLFIDLLVKNLDGASGSGASQLSIHAAGQCAEELASQIGIGIFRGRLEELGGTYVFDRVMEERKRERHVASMIGGILQ